MYFVVLVAAFLVFSAVVASGVTFGVDDAVARYFKSIQGSNPSIDMAMIVITSLGDVTTLFILGIVLTIIRRTRKVGMIFLIALVHVAFSLELFASDSVCLVPMQFCTTHLTIAELN